MENLDCPGCQEWAWARRFAELEARVLVLDTPLRDRIDQRKPPTAGDAALSRGTSRI